MHHGSKRSARRIAAAVLLITLSGCIPVGQAVVPLPAVPLCFIDSVLRGAQGTATREYDVWELVKAMPERERRLGSTPAIDVLIARAGTDVPAVRGRLRWHGSGGLVLRTRPDIEAAFGAWLAQECARRGVSEAPSKPGGKW